MFIKAVAAGTAHLKDEDFKEYLAELDKLELGGMHRRKAQRARTPEEFAAQVQALGQPGFKVIIED